MSTDLNRFRGCLLGLAVGDAVGTTVEFQARGSFPQVTDMRGGGPFHLQAGKWTDDTSMALCLAESLLAENGFNAKDQMERYWSWYQAGYLSSTGRCFDIGNTVRSALERYHRSGDPWSGPTAKDSAGNGSLMRLAPVALLYYPDLEKTVYFAGESSRTTHGAQECIEACRLFAEMLFRVLSGSGKDEVLLGTTLDLTAPKIKDIAKGDYYRKSINQIRGSGYVVESLEAALWCFYRTSTFKEAILQAVDLGEDADTTAAICGQIAGAYYGESSIPVQWRERLFMRVEITRLADELSVRRNL